jgi:hypothetical protein
MVYAHLFVLCFLSKDANGVSKIIAHNSITSVVGCYLLHERDTCCGFICLVNQYKFKLEIKNQTFMQYVSIFYSVGFHSNFLERGELKFNFYN